MANSVILRNNYTDGNGVGQSAYSLGATLNVVTTQMQWATPTFTDINNYPITSASNNQVIKVVMTGNNTSSTQSVTDSDVIVTESAGFTFVSGSITINGTPAPSATLASIPVGTTPASGSVEIIYEAIAVSNTI